MSIDPRLAEAARDWLAGDPDATTRAELQTLLSGAQAGDSAALTELTDSFTGTLEFGTAGLRGALGPGPNRMNQVVVARAAAGLADYLTRHGGGSVVIGHDARHGSADFARISAEVLSGAGLNVLMLPPLVPTPLLAYAVLQLKCSAGVMVTASHNPRRDNGYKVYLADGCQIVPPADAEISACIAEVTARGPISLLPRATDWQLLGDDIIERYVIRAASLVAGDAVPEIRVAYTPIHGVGAPVFTRVMAAAGMAEPFVVRSQAQPDPDFGGMPFPNPEEPGVMDAVLKLAHEQACDVAIANDPDADRCAIGIPTPDGWRTLSGDEVGWLLGWWMAAQPEAGAEPRVLAQSIVSGSLLEQIATDAGIGYTQTLTGFKWIARVPGLAYGYEEALGYCVDPAAVRDKDGITAGLMVVDMVRRLAARGLGLQDVLDDLARQHGVFVTRQVSVRHDERSRIDAVMSALRTHPPATLGGRKVERVDDLEKPHDDLPPTDGLRFVLAGNGRVIVRPSGTEAKVKSYLQVCVPVGNEGLEAARRQAETAVAALRDDITELLS